jgi:hypothetical protein
MHGLAQLIGMFRNSGTESLMHQSQISTLRVFAKQLNSVMTVGKLAIEYSFVAKLDLTALVLFSHSS